MVGQGPARTNAGLVVDDLGSAPLVFGLGEDGAGDAGYVAGDLRVAFVKDVEGTFFPADVAILLEFRLKLSRWI